MIFLPLACSTAMLPYYHEIQKIELENEGISVVAMEFGIKNALFDEYLLRDAWLMTFGGIFVLFCMWLYTGSLFLTFMTIIAIIFSLGISYFLYMLVFELNFFPFMNLLATVVAVGKNVVTIKHLFCVPIENNCVTLFVVYVCAFRYWSWWCIYIL